MNIIRVDKNNQINGPGLRCVIWVAGCENYCQGCHNPETWDYQAGHILQEEEWQLIKSQLASAEISGITFTGGDPLAPHNRAATAVLCAAIKDLYPNKTIWIYTGYIFDDVREYLRDVDVLVDGPYIETLNPTPDKIKWRGSTNQRVIDVQESLAEGRIMEYLDFNGQPISKNEQGD